MLHIRHRLSFDARLGKVSLLFTLSLVIASGLMLGQLRVAGVRLGAAGVLFSGMILGHFGFSVEPAVQAFLGDFGLILFLFAMGLTIGPGFLNALRAHGLKFNLLAASVVLMGVLLTCAINRFGGDAADRENPPRSG